MSEDLKSSAEEPEAENPESRDFEGVDGVVTDEMVDEVSESIMEGEAVVSADAEATETVAEEDEEFDLEEEKTKMKSTFKSIYCKTLIGWCGAKRLSRLGKWRMNVVWSRWLGLYEMVTGKFEKLPWKPWLKLVHRLLICLFVISEIGNLANMSSEH